MGGRKKETFGQVVCGVVSRLSQKCGFTFSPRGEGEKRRVAKSIPLSLEEGQGEGGQIGLPQTL